MKINGYQPPNGVQPSESSRSQQSAKTNQAKSTATQNVGQQDVVTHLSQLPQDTSKDIDTARVDELRQAIRDGKLNMRADAIAESLLQSLSDGLDK